jgi:hypothetical protein
MRKSYSESMGDSDPSKEVLIAADKESGEALKQWSSVYTDTAKRSANDLQNSKN